MYEKKVLVIYKDYTVYDLDADTGIGDKIAEGMGLEDAVIKSRDYKVWPCSMPQTADEHRGDRWDG